MRRIFSLVLTLSVIIALVGAAVPAGASPSDEAQFVDLINQSRNESGLGGLAEYWDLTDDARVHTADMIGAGQVFHSSSAQLGSYTTGWARLGENVGMGPNPALLHQAFMNSSSHRANILGDYDRIGVGVDRAADGTMFVTVLFMKSASVVTTTTAPPPPSTTTTAPPSTTTVPPSTTTTVPPSTTTTSTAPPPQPTTTTTVAPPPTTSETETTTSSAPGPDGESSRAAEILVRVSVGDRPASKAADATTVRNVASFRPIFATLASAGSDPIVVWSSNGFPLVIE